MTQIQTRENAKSTSSERMSPETILNILMNISPKNSRSNKMGQIQIPEDANHRSFERMPPEIIETIIIKLPIEEIQQFCRVNKQILSLCSTKTFWKKLVKRDFHVNKLVIGVCWKFQYQLLSTQIYVYKIHTDFTDEHELFLTSLGAFKKFISDIDSHGDLLELNIDYTHLSDITGICQNDIDSIINVDHDTLLKIIQTDKVKRKQYLRIRKYIHAGLFEDFEEKFSYWGCYVLESTTGAKYTIYSECFNLEDHISSDFELDFIQTHHRVDGTEEIYLQKQKLSTVLLVLKHYNGKNCKKAVLKNGTLTQWNEKGDENTREPLNPKFNSRFTTFLKQNAQDLIES